MKLRCLEWVLKEKATAAVIAKNLDSRPWPSSGPAYRNPRNQRPRVRRTGAAGRWPQAEETHGRIILIGDFLVQVMRRSRGIPSCDSRPRARCTVGPWSGSGATRFTNSLAGYSRAFHHKAGELLNPVLLNGLSKIVNFTRQTYPYRGILISQIIIVQLNYKIFNICNFYHGSVICNIKILLPEIARYILFLKIIHKWSISGNPLKRKDFES